jgi:hypothetical protein
MFQLNSSLNVSANNGKQTLLNIASSDVLVVLNSAQTFQGGDLIERNFKSGNTFSIRWMQGTLKGKLIPLSYGETEILFDVPNLLQSFDLELIPSRLQFEYSVEIFTRIFNPVYAELTERFDIPLQLLQKMPEQTLQILKGLFNVPQSDTRQARLDAIAAKELAQAAQLTADSANTAVTTLGTTVSTIDGKVSATEAELISVSQEMIINEEFQLVQTSFILENGFYVADVTHTLSGSRPDMTLVDSIGDEQGQAQMIVKSPTVVRVELDPSQWADNTYPMFLTLQGKKSTPVVAQGWVALPGANRSFRISNGNLENSTDQGVNVNLMGTDIVEAFVSVMESQVWAKNQSNEYLIFGSNGAYLAAGSEVAYAAKKVLPDSISL